MTEQMTHRKWVFITGGCFAASFMLLAALNFAIDPVQYFREASFYRPYFHGNYCRHLNPGMARHRRYDTVILGSSYMANTDSAMVDEKLHLRSLNLTMFGATLKEIRLILGVALRTGQVKRVLWGMDVDAILEDPEKIRTDDFPLYLYDDNACNDYRYVTDFYLLYRLLNKIVPLNISGGASKASGFETAYNWMDVKRPFFNGEMVYRGWKKAPLITGAEKRNQICMELFENGRRNIARNLLPIMKGNPSVSFTVIYMPYSALYWINADRSGALEAHVMIKKELFEKTKGLGNVAIFDPQDDPAIILDLDNYCDTGHFSEKVNRRLIDAVIAGKYRVTGDNVDAVSAEFLRTVRRAARHFR